MDTRQIVLAGGKIALAEMLEADQPHFHRWLTGQPELRAMIDDPNVPSMDDQMRWFQRSKQDDRRMFSLVTVPGGTLVGNAGFVDIDPKERTAQFRITIGDPESRGKGYGREALSLLLRFAEQSMGLTKVWLRVRKDNTAARALYEKAGFMVREEYPATEGRAAGMIMEKVCR